MPEFLTAPTDPVGAAVYIGWLQFIAIGLATIVAIWGVISQRAIARRKGTLDYITRQESDGDIIAARKEFIALAHKPGGLAIWAEKDKEDTEEINSIRIVLNEFELLAIGIQRGVIDFETYKRWHRTGTLTFWKHSEPFITHLRGRTGNDALYHEFQELVGWLNKSKMPKRSHLLGRWF